MIKKISDGKRAQEQSVESHKLDARTVSKAAAEQFSSLVNKKPTASKEISKSPKLKKSVDKVKAKLAEKMGEAKTTARRTPISKNDSSADKQKSNDQEALPQSLDAFDIAAMAARSNTQTQSAPPVAETTPAPFADLSKIVNEIADRILVSSPADNPTGAQEIRIHLKESVLSDTEVRIYRHAGSLQVEFLSGSKDSQMFIAQKQPDIQKILGERLANETVNVSVQDSQQTRGGQGEGRSRQQYIDPDADNQP